MTEVLLYHVPGVVIPLAIYLVSRLWPKDSLPLPPCTFLTLTGIPCPTCGFTRSFLWMGRGEGVRAFVNSPLASLFYVAILAFMVINLAALALRARITPGRLFRWRARGWWIFGFTIVALLFANWGYRLAMGMK